MFNQRIIPEYVYRDPELDPNYDPSNYVSFKYQSGDARIFGQIIVPDGRYEAPRPCVILCHGFPGAVTMDDLGHALARAGAVCVIAHYRGAWGSEGKYLLTNVVEDAKNLATYMHDEGPALYNVDPDAIFFLGHSMGCCASINASRHLPWVRGLILTAPYDPIRDIDRDNAEPFRNLLNYGDVLTSDGPDAIFDNAIRHRDDLSFEVAAKYIQDKNILMIYAGKDFLAPPSEMVFPFWEKLEGLQAAAAAKTDVLPLREIKEYPVGHGLYGCRTTVAHDAAVFMEECLK